MVLIDKGLTEEALDMIAAEDMARIAHGQTGTIRLYSEFGNVDRMWISRSYPQ